MYITFHLSLNFSVDELFCVLVKDALIDFSVSFPRPPLKISNLKFRLDTNLKILKTCYILILNLSNDF